MNFYIITQSTNYGEFFEIICANNIYEAYEISEAKKLGWDNKNMQELIMPLTPQSILLGGGDQ